MKINSWYDVCSGLCVGLFLCLVLVCIVVFWFVLLFSGLYCCLLVCIVVYWFVLTGLYCCLLVCIVVYWFVLLFNVRNVILHVVDEKRC